MKECVPDVLDVLAAVEIPNVTAHEDSAKQIAPLCTAYGIRTNVYPVERSKLDTEDEQYIAQYWTCLLKGHLMYHN